MSDAPDWQKVVTVTTSVGEVTDAPDWQRVVVAPGGVPISGGGGGGSTEDIYPPDDGMYGWSIPFTLSNSAAILTSVGDLGLTRVKAAASGTVGSLYTDVTIVGSGFTADENYVGLYQPVLSSGALTSLSLLGSSAAGAADTPFTTLGIRTVPLSPGVAVTAGSIYYVGWVTNGSPGRMQLSSTSALTASAQAPPLVYPYSLTYPGHSLTALPNSVTVSACTQYRLLWWWALGP